MEDLDLEKIADFMNSPVEEGIDKNEIENALDYIDTQIANVKKETKEIKTQEDIDKQQSTIDSLTKIALEKMGKVDKKTDEIFDLFYNPILLKQDRSDASKQALVESQRIKVEMINAITNLVNAQAKLEVAKQKQATGNTGIFINTMTGAQAGVSLHDLWEESK